MRGCHSALAIVSMQILYQIIIACHDSHTLDCIHALRPCKFRPSPPPDSPPPSPTPSVIPSPQRYLTLWRHSYGCERQHIAVATAVFPLSGRTLSHLHGGPYRMFVTVAAQRPAWPGSAYRPQILMAVLGMLTVNGLQASSTTHSDSPRVPTTWRGAATLVRTFLSQLVQLHACTSGACLSPVQPSPTCQHVASEGCQLNPLSDWKQPELPARLAGRMHPHPHRPLSALPH